MNKQLKKYKTLTGRVVKVDANKTVAVLVERLVSHPKYKKYVTKCTKFLAHDEQGIVKEGNVVSIRSCSPFSKRKSWMVFSE